MVYSRSICARLVCLDYWTTQSQTKTICCPKEADRHGSIDMRSRRGLYVFSDVSPSCPTGGGVVSHAPKQNLKKIQTKSDQNPNKIKTMGKNKNNIQTKSQPILTKSRQNPNKIQTKTRHNLNKIAIKSTHNHNKIHTKSQQNQNQIQTKSEQSPDKILTK